MNNYELEYLIDVNAISKIKKEEDFFLNHIILGNLESISRFEIDGKEIDISIEINKDGKYFFINDDEEIKFNYQFKMLKEGIFIFSITFDNIEKKCDLFYEEEMDITGTNENEPKVDDSEISYKNTPYSIKKISLFENIKEYLEKVIMDETKNKPLVLSNSYEAYICNEYYPKLYDAKSFNKGNVSFYGCKLV